jgi:acetyltransferase-like isoleucine patch superfamily enzyme
MTPLALWQRTPLAGLTNMLRFATRGVRLHPAARIYGAARALDVGRDSKIGPGCVFNLGGGGKIRLGRSVWTYRDVEFHTESQIEIGAGASFQRGALINGTVAIGRGCIFAPGVFVSSGRHVYDLRPAWPIRAQEALLANKPNDPDVARYRLDRPVRVDEDCWLGAHVVVAPGVRIGRGAIVGANSVVTRDVEPYAIVAGAPARSINQRLPWRPPAVLDASRAAARPYLYSGFDVDEGEGEFVAAATGEVSVALAPSSAGALDICFDAAAPGALICAGKSVDFAAGRNDLRVSADSAGAAVLLNTAIVPLRFVFERSGGSARLLACGWVAAAA